MLSRLRHLPQRLAGQVRLLRNDPEQVGRNLLQFTDPARFEARVLDVARQLPLHLRVEPRDEPTLNVLQPVLDSNSMTGGPNTIVVLAALIAEQDVPVRIVTNRIGHRPDPAWFRTHMASLLGRSPSPLLGLAVASNADDPASIGASDVWLATHWTTAQGLKPVLPRMRRPGFIYLVQDFEPGFYAWSSNYALALETYGMDFHAAINERFLAEHLLEQAAGRFAEPGFLDRRCRIFDPAVDRRAFHPPTTAPRGPTRTLLFYARPTNPRNMVGLGVQALRDAVAAGTFGSEWRFLAVGARNSIPPITLGNGRTLEPAPWQSYDDYAGGLREAEVLLCPMLSPHTSYPVLEMAACGGRVVTNSYGAKTAEALRALSPMILAAPPTVEGFAAALAEAVAAGLPSPRTDQLALPATWDEALTPIAQWIAELIRGEMASPK